MNQNRNNNIKIGIIMSHNLDKLIKNYIKINNNIIIKETNQIIKISKLTILGIKTKKAINHSS